MDTAQPNTQINPSAPQPVPTPQIKPHTGFRLIFLLLLLAVLISAGATTYILISSKNSQVPATQPTAEENPFDSVSVYTNPFTDETTVTTVNPFAETSTSSANPFDQFADQANTTQTDTYQNPF